MQLKLKNDERKFTVATPPTERITNGGEKAFWLISFTLSDALSSDEADRLFAPENTEELTFSAPLPNGEEYEYTVKGYTNRAFCAIRYASDGGCTVEIQLSKEANITEG